MKSISFIQTISVYFIVFQIKAMSGYTISHDKIATTPSQHNYVYYRF